MGLYLYGIKTHTLADSDDIVFFNQIITLFLEISFTFRNKKNRHAQHEKTRFLILFFFTIPL